MTGPIYTPKGEAREYSPLALNVYTGCSHGCKYCYNRDRFPGPVVPRKNLLADLQRQLESGPITEQVHISFVGDPYCPEETDLRMTRQVLELLLEHRVPVQLLTKGGRRCLRDLDLFKAFGPLIKVGATLTVNLAEVSLEWEPNAALPSDRLTTLSVLHDEGIRTWVSIEPVINSRESFWCVWNSIEDVDEYKLGRWNHDRRATEIDWREYGTQVVTLLRNANKAFYVKSGLRPYIDGLTAEECDRDRQNIRGAR